MVVVAVLVLAVVVLAVVVLAVVVLAVVLGADVGVVCGFGVGAVAVVCCCAALQKAPSSKAASLRPSPPWVPSPRLVCSAASEKYFLVAPAECPRPAPARSQTATLFTAAPKSRQQCLPEIAFGVIDDLRISAEITTSTSTAISTKKPALGQLLLLPRLDLLDRRIMALTHGHPEHDGSVVWAMETGTRRNAPIRMWSLHSGGIVLSTKSKNVFWKLCTMLAECAPTAALKQRIGYVVCALRQTMRLDRSLNWCFTDCFGAEDRGRGRGGRRL